VLVREEAFFRETVESSAGMDLASVLTSEACRVYDLWADAQDDLRHAVDIFDVEGVTALVPRRDVHAACCDEAIRRARAILPTISTGTSAAAIRQFNEDLSYMASALAAFFESQTRPDTSGPLISRAEQQHVPESGMNSALSPRLRLKSPTPRPLPLTQPSAPIPRQPSR